MVKSHQRFDWGELAKRARGRSPLKINKHAEGGLERKGKMTVTLENNTTMLLSDINYGDVYIKNGLLYLTDAYPVKRLGDKLVSDYSYEDLCRIVN